MVLNEFDERDYCIIKKEHLLYVCVNLFYQRLISSLMDGLFAGESVNDYYCRKCQRRKDISWPKAEFEVEVIKWFFRCWLDTWHDLVLYNARLLPFSLRTSVPNSGWHRLLPLSVTCQCHMITLVVPIYLNLELMNFNCLQFPPKSHLHPFFFPRFEFELNWTEVGVGH